MTALNKKYRDKPEYQIARQKMTAMTPQQQAVMSNQGVEDYFMDRQISKQLRLKQLGTEKMRTDKGAELSEKKLEESQRQFDVGLEFGKESFAGQMGLAEQQLDFYEEEQDQAASIAKWGTLVGLASGIEGFMHERRMARYYRTIGEGIE